jgi:hypothetical protein
MFKSSSEPVTVHALTQDGFRNLLDIIRLNISAIDERAYTILSDIQLFFTSVYATGTFQLGCGNLCKFSHLAESRVIKCIPEANAYLRLRDTLVFVHGTCSEELKSVISFVLWIQLTVQICKCYDSKTCESTILRQVALEWALWIQRNKIFLENIKRLYSSKLTHTQRVDSELPLSVSAVFE